MDWNVNLQSRIGEATRAIQRALDTAAAVAPQHSDLLFRAGAHPAARPPPMCINWGQTPISFKSPD